MKFVYTTALRKVRAMSARVRVVPGGTSAGKTFAILPVLIDMAARTPGLEVSVVSESLPHLRRGALKDFKKIMKATGRWSEPRWHSTLSTYTFANGATIEFFGADADAKLRGARRHVLYVNEANNVKWKAYHELASRTSHLVFLDFNPTAEFWAHEELADDPRTEWLTLTYLDNEAAPANVATEMEEAKRKAERSSYWANWWRVYGLGLTGSVQGVVYPDWEKAPNVPAGARLLAYGLDFGFNHPSALVALFEAPNGSVVLDEVLYASGLTTPALIERLKKLNLDKRAVIWADSAAPDKIEELRAAGFNCRPANKAPGSVKYGIELLQSRDLLVTERSVGLIDNLRKYVWDTGRDGKALEQPVKRDDDALDAARYAALGSLSARASKKRAIR